MSKNKKYERVVQRGGVIKLSPLKIFLVDCDLIGTIGYLDPDGLKFYPIYDLKHPGYDVQVLDTHV